MLSNFTDRSLQFFKFCLVGAVNTSVDLAVFIFLTAWSVPMILAQGISYTCGLLNSFFMNRAWTFKRRGQLAGQFARFLALNVVTLTLTYGLLVLFHYYMAWSTLASKFVATGVGLVLNFTGSRLWVFS
jgi:putative flippase GtrA